MREAVAALEERRRLHEAGALPAAYVEQAERELAAAERELEEAQKPRSTRPTASSSRPRCSSGWPSCRPLPRGGYEDPATLVRFNGTSPWSLKSVPALEQRFAAAFGRACRSAPSDRRRSTTGSASITGRRSTSPCTPDSAEGRWLMQDLRQAGIPFIGVRGVVPGASTGAHVHIGPDRPGCWCAEDAGEGALTLGGRRFVASSA